MTLIKGGCLCGRTTYQADTVIQRTINCHCHDCQKATGSVHTTLIFIDRTALEIHGAPRSFTHSADSGSIMTKHFCTFCGTQLFSENSRRAGAIGIRAGTIDDKSIIAPQMNIFTDSAVPSTPMAADLPQHKGMPG